MKYSLPLETALHDLYMIKQGYEPDGIYPACLDVAIELCKERIEHEHRLENMVNELAREHNADE
jgi:hypothetical protein